MKDLHLLPKVRDSLSFLYVEHCKIDQEDRAIAIHDAQGKVPVPCASLTLLMLGPGTSVTHAAIRALAENGCLVLWTGEDPINRAVSCANSCLYGVCHAAIVSAGYSPALGFIHTGKMLSFVYDVADLYKAETAVPVAFRAVAAGTADLEGRVRRACRDAFHERRLLQRIVADIDSLLDLPVASEPDGEVDFDAEDAVPGGLWDPEVGQVDGGVNRGDEFGER